MSLDHGWDHFWFPQTLEILLALLTSVLTDGGIFPLPPSPTQMCFLGV